jgi:hypothetical protein
MLQEIEFAPDSPLEGAGFEPSVPREGNHALRTAPLTATAFPFGRKRRLVREGDTVRILPSPARRLDKTVKRQDEGGRENSNMLSRRTLGRAMAQGAAPG